MHPKVSLAVSTKPRISLGPFFYVYIVATAERTIPNLYVHSDLLTKWHFPADILSYNPKATNTSNDFGDRSSYKIEKN